MPYEIALHCFKVYQHEHLVINAVAITMVFCNIELIKVMGDGCSLHFLFMCIMYSSSVMNF